MLYFLAVQNTFQHFEIALFNSAVLIDSKQRDKHDTSSLFIPFLNTLLTNHKIAINELNFIVVNQGPGPFSTLRSIIASVNGLSFATQIPLIGIDGLQATLRQYQPSPEQNTIVLLNAFNFDVYFAIKQNNKQAITGYKKIDAFLYDLQTQHPDKTWYFIGNGVELYKDQIKNMLADRAIIPDPLPSMCTIEHIGIMGLEKWHTRELSSELFPLYLKKHSAEIKT